MAGIKVYGIMFSPNVVRVVATLNEKGLDFQLVPVNLPAGGHKKPEFLALNPFGQVPAFEDGDIKMFESRAITRYIAARYKGTGVDLIPGQAPAELAAQEIWIESESQNFKPPATRIGLELLVKPFKGLQADEAVVEAAAKELSAVLDVYEQHLSKNKYFAGEEFTLADLHHMPNFSTLLMTPKAGLITSRPHVKAWWDTVSARPAWKKTAAAMKP